jgi:hypothetical protein
MSNLTKSFTFKNLSTVYFKHFPISAHEIDWSYAIAGKEYNSIVVSLYIVRKHSK